VAFDSRRNIHLHRLDGTKGYSEGNCVLMHADCHRRLHAAAETDEDENQARGDGGGRNVSPIKWSKRYHEMPFLYWWDVSPALAESLNEFDTIEFGKKDTGEQCIVPAETLEAYLTPDRQTSRGQGNWGIKVLNDRPDELAFEPGTGKRGRWVFLPATWINEQEED
jgi:hypothetical protein